MMSWQLYKEVNQKRLIGIRLESEVYFEDDVMRIEKSDEWFERAAGDGRTEVTADEEQVLWEVEERPVD